MWWSYCSLPASSASAADDVAGVPALRLNVHFETEICTGQTGLDRGIRFCMSKVPILHRLILSQESSACLSSWALISPLPWYVSLKSYEEDVQGLPWKKPQAPRMASHKLNEW